jgi:urease accessory protein
MSVAGLLLGDSRFPAGGHAHSGGMEPAVTAGTVAGLDSLELFLRGRLRTAGLVAAAIAAAACDHALIIAGPVPGSDLAGTADAPGLAFPADAGHGAGDGSAATVRDDGFWAELDAETDARTPSPAQREASRRQGRALLRAARVAWPDAPALAELAASVASRGTRTPGGPRAAGGSGVAAGAATGAPAVPERREYRGGPHHAVVLGAAAAAAGCEPREAARIAAYQAAAGPVSAAVRLLALDPMRATGVLARLAGDIDQIAEQGAGYAGQPPADLPCPSAPALDLLAETHIRAEVRLFES